ncbi:unnamed protein product [Arabis nemorensis]|uniref:SURP motif domain-containing protein n=1 Tax=Arabis nemorensis TaxID=586526 RepID=A0A565CMM4_9BRAS|nr:unnamed protein product [Arabis nemorensis]
MELVIIKLTAGFVVRYGMLFCRDLMKKVVDKPQFQLFKFMVATDRRFHVYDVVVDAVSNILEPSYDA